MIHHQLRATEDTLTTFRLTAPQKPTVLIHTQATAQITMHATSIMATLALLPALLSAAALPATDGELVVRDLTSCTNCLISCTLAGVRGSDAYFKYVRTIRLV